MPLLIWPYVHLTQYTEKNGGLVFFKKIAFKHLWTTPKVLYKFICLKLSVSKYSRKKKWPYVKYNSLGFFSSQKKNLASCKLRMSPDSGCLWSISIRVLVYSGFSPGHKAGPRWLLLTREQCMTDHVRLFWSQSTYTVYLCTGATQKHI